MINLLIKNSKYVRAILIDFLTQRLSRLRLNRNKKTLSQTEWVMWTVECGMENWYLNSVAT